MEKKTKLTISGTAKKSFKNIELAKTQNKNSVVIDKQSNKFPNRGGLSRPGSFKPKTGSTRPKTGPRQGQKQPFLKEKMLQTSTETHYFLMVFSV